MNSSEEMASKRKRRNNWPHGKKLALIEAVKSNEPLWNTNNAKHSDSNAVNASWLKIAAELGKNVDDCKSAWRSLRDSRRYYLNSKLKKKSTGDGCERVGSPWADDIGDWEYLKELSFLPVVNTKRTAFKNTEFTSPPDAEYESSCSTSNYVYDPSSTPQTPAYETSSPVPESSSERIANIFEAFVAERSQKHRPHATSLAYMEELFNKLPQEDADELKFEFIIKLQAKVASLRRH